MRYLFSIVFLAMALTGCAGSPSDNEIESQLVEHYQGDGTEEFISVENVRKTNGFKQDSNSYIADVEYELVFKKGLKEWAEQINKESQGSLFGTMGAGVSVMALQMQYGDFEAGHTVKKEEKITFQKTENGWRLAE